MDAAEAQGGVHAKQPLRRSLRLAQKLIEVVDLPEDPPGMLVEDFALRRQAHPPRRAVDQGKPQPSFDVSQSLAHGGRRNPELAAGAAEAAAVGKRHEEAELRRLDACAHADL